MTFFLHAAVYNDYADEDIPDTVGDLPEADIPDPVPAEEPAASPSPTAVPPPDEDSEDSSSPSQSPSPSPSQAYPLPRKPARFGRRSPPPVNVTQFMLLAGGLGLAAAISCADAVTDSFGTDCQWEVPSGRAGGDSRRMGNKRKAAEITRSAAEDFALLTCRTTSEKQAAEFLSTVTNVVHLT